MNAETNYLHFFLDTIYITKRGETSKKVEKQTTTGEIESSKNKQKVNIQIGNYEKKVLVTTDDELNEKTKALLVKIFNAINIKIKDMLVTSSPVRLKSLVNFDLDKPVVMIHFTADEGVKYEFINQNKIHILYSDSLEAIDKSPNLKVSLWNAIKSSILPKLNPINNSL